MKKRNGFNTLALLSLITVLSTLWGCNALSKKTINFTLEVDVTQPYTDAQGAPLQAQELLSKSVEVIKNRLGAYDVEEPTVSIVPGKPQITVAFKGRKRLEYIAKILTAPGRLRAYELVPNSEYFDVLDKIDITLKKLVGAEPKKYPVFLDGGEPADLPFFTRVMSPSLDYKKDILEGGIVGSIASKDTALLNDVLEIDKIKNILIPDTKMRYETPDQKGRMYVICTKGHSFLNGGYISGGEEKTDSKGAYYFELKLNDEGAQIWRSKVNTNIGRYFAVIIDNDKTEIIPASKTIAINDNILPLYNYYVVNESTLYQAIFKGGQLPAPVKIVNGSSEY